MNGEAILKAFSNLDLSRVKGLKKEVLGLAVIAALSFLFYRFVYHGNVREMERLESETALARGEIARITSEMQAAENLKKPVLDVSANLKRLDLRLKNLKEWLPADRRVSKILGEISGNDLNGGIRVLSVKPLAPEEKGELTRLPFHLTMEARFASFGEYLENIEHQPRLIIVDNFIIEPKDENSSILASQVFLSAYILNR